MKKQISDIWAAVLILLVLGVVFYVYGRGLLGGPQAENGEPPGMPGLPPPPIMGDASLKVTTMAGATEVGYADGPGASARFNAPAAVAAGPGGVIYVADSRNHRIRAIAPDGTVTTAAGGGPTDQLDGGFADGPAGQARFSAPSGLAVRPDGAVYIADTGNHLIRVLSGGVVRTLAGGETEADGAGLRTGGHAGGAGTAARFRFPAGLCLTRDGSLLVADPGNSAIRRVTAEGVVTTVLRGGRLQAPTNLALRADGALLIADPAAGAVWVHAGGALQRLEGLEMAPAPGGVVQMPDGALLVSCTQNSLILRVAAPGVAALFAGTYATDQTVRGYMDGTGENALFWTPCDIKLAAGGSVIVADFGNNCIRRISR